MDRRSVIAISHPHSAMTRDAFPHDSSRRSSMVQIVSVVRKSVRLVMIGAFDLEIVPALDPQDRGPMGGHT
jgi:hypothetical protein